jgi:peptide/nickel transport system substrate-binding protein
MYFEFIGFNFTREIFAQQSIRRGIAHAFNADEAISTLYLHHATRASAPVHPNGWMADPTVRGYVHDPAMARVLLRNFPRDEEQPLIIIVNEESTERVAIARRLATGLAEARLDAEVVALPTDEFSARLIADDYDLYVGWAELSFAPDFAFLFNGQRTGGVLFNHDPQLEALFAVTLTAATESTFLSALSQFQHAFAENLPVIGLAFRHSAVLMGTRVQSDIPPAPCNIFLYANKWKINSN